VALHQYCAVQQIGRSHSSHSCNAPKAQRPGEPEQGPLEGPRPADGLAAGED
jgi:hypothetical protein